MKKNNIRFHLGKRLEAVESTMLRIKEDKVAERIWSLDHKLWSDKPDEITNRLGWLFCPDSYAKEADNLVRFAEEVKNDGIKKVLLLGMGGSSLAPEVFGLVYESAEGHPELEVIDSTHPEKILEYGMSIDPAEVLFVVSTKSGTTVETVSFMKYFYTLAADKLGQEEAGKHFVAITDPGSKLESTAKELKFRKTFINDPNIGGRYSVLSYFGMVPAALAGIDIGKLLDNAKKITCECGNDKCEDKGEDSGVWLGAAIGEMASQGVDKLTFVTSKEIFPFVDWAEQLIAESVGKIGKGIVPVPEEKVAENLGIYSRDRLFVLIGLQGDSAIQQNARKLTEAGFPVIYIELESEYDLGAEFFRWEYATAIAGWKLEVHPFDQPNVESAKVRAKEMLAAYKEKGTLPELEKSFSEHDIDVVTDEKGTSIRETMNNFFVKIHRGEEYIKGRSYCSVQAFVNPGEGVTEAMKELKRLIEKKYKIAVTYNYGPRFLHSTGQLHKGDEGNGLFIQFVSKEYQDAPIPDEAGKAESAVSFGTLVNAQALGDRKALIDNKRDVIRFELKAMAEEGIRYVLQEIKAG